MKDIPQSLLELLDDFEANWGDHGAWDAMKLDLLLIVAAAKREEAEERGKATNRIIDQAFSGEV